MNAVKPQQVTGRYVPGIFEIKAAKNNQYYVLLRAEGNRKVLAKSEEFKTLRGAYRNIAAQIRAVDPWLPHVALFRIGHGKEQELWIYHDHVEVL
jgi:uncharacterized protein YegP (UPF0339 family)